MDQLQIIDGIKSQILYNNDEGLANENNNSLAPTLNPIVTTNDNTQIALEIPEENSDPFLQDCTLKQKALLGVLVLGLNFGITIILAGLTIALAKAAINQPFLFLSLAVMVAIAMIIYIYIGCLCCHAGAYCICPETTNQYGFCPR